jgi:2-dehydro-3-deoxygalactonokinase
VFCCINKWYERHLFFEALIAAEDMHGNGQLDFQIQTMPSIFTWLALRNDAGCICTSWRDNFQRQTWGQFPISGEIDELSIKGILRIVKKAGLIG